MELSQTRYEVESGVAKITLDRPDKMNAFTATMRKELVKIFQEADRDDAVRVVVVTGAGEALTIAKEIAENTSAISVALSKALLWHGLGEKDPQSAHLIESRCFHWIGRQQDAREGVQGFLDRRKPVFTMSPTIHMPDSYPWWKEPKV